VKESDELANRAIVWYQSRPDAEMTEDRTYNVINALIHAGRLVEARTLVEKAMHDNPSLRNLPVPISLLGRIAARLGDSTAARSAVERLRGMKRTYAEAGSRIGSTYGRAIIAAGLGDRPTAVTLLQQALAEGNYFEPYLHREIEFQSIQDYPPLKELIWPKG
jgi:hypothetical protein